MSDQVEEVKTDGFLRWRSVSASLERVSGLGRSFGAQGHARWDVVAIDDLFVLLFGLLPILPWPKLITNASC